MAGWKIFDSSPFRSPGLGFQPASDPIGVYGTLWMTYPAGGFMPRAVIAPITPGYPRNVYMPPKYVVGPAEPEWDEESNGPRQRFY
jgi:hypothetical protein